MTIQDKRISAAIEKIRGLNEDYVARAQKHLDSLTKPIGSLGLLESVAAQYVAWREEDRPEVARKAVYVFAGDHGICDEGISAYPREVTPQMVENFLAGGAGINVLSRHAGADVVVVDAGVDADFKEHPGLIRHKIRRGTRNFAREAAMTQEEVEAALMLGIELAQRAKREGRTLIALGEMGIGNTTSASAIVAMLTGASVERVTGMGTGLSNERTAHKAHVIDAALAMHFKDRIKALDDPLEILRRVGGLEIAAIAGMVLGAASERIAVVIDGFICTSGAAIACAMVPAAKAALFAGHQSEEPGHAIILSSMGLKPILQLGMRLGEGTGAVLSFNLIEASLKIYREMATFASAGVSEAS